MNVRIKAHLALGAVALIYGANYVIAKTVMPDPIGPNSFIILRVGGAVLLFWLLMLRRFQWPDKQDWPRIILCGLSGVAINQLCFFNGLALTSPLNSSIIMTSNPIMVMLISAVLLKTKITAQKIVGLMLGALGAILIIILSSSGRNEGVNVIGDTFILVNSLSYAFYLVLVKPLMSKYHPMVVITWVFTVGFIAVIPFGWSSVGTVPWGDFHFWQWAAILFVIVFVTFLAYLLNIIALNILTPTIASAYIYFQPILAGLFAFLFSLFMDKNYAGDFSIEKVGCTLLIFAGIYLVSKPIKESSGLTTD